MSDNVRFIPATGFIFSTEQIIGDISTTFWVCLELLLTRAREEGGKVDTERTRETRLPGVCPLCSPAKAFGSTYNLSSRSRHCFALGAKSTPGQTHRGTCLNKRVFEPKPHMLPAA